MFENAYRHRFPSCGSEGTISHSYRVWSDILFRVETTTRASWVRGLHTVVLSHVLTRHLYKEFDTSYSPDLVHGQGTGFMNRTFVNSRSFVHLLSYLKFYLLKEIFNKIYFLRGKVRDLPRK